MSVNPTVFERPATKAKTKVGRIYKKWRKGPDGTRVDQSTWTVRYKGVDYATGETDLKMAEKFLKIKVGDIAHGKKPGAIDRTPAAAAPVPEPDVVLMDAVFDGANANARRKENATARENVGRMAKHLRPFFGHLNAKTLTSADFENYIDHRMDAEAANATVNRELAILKRALRLAVNREPPLIDRFPKIDMLPPSPPRKGFLRHAAYEALKAALPARLVPPFVAAYHIGNRRSELLQVEIQDVEMDAIPQPQFRLYGDATKNGEGRVIPVYGEMVEVFRAQIEMTRRQFPGCPWLFHEEGVPIRTFYKAWATATKAAGLEGLLFHDLRRTAVRNLIRAKVDRKVAMQITGHKTEVVFNRYNITSEEDLSDAADKMVVYLAKLSGRLTPGSPLVS